MNKMKNKCKSKLHLFLCIYDCNKYELYVLIINIIYTCCKAFKIAD